MKIALVTPPVAADPIHPYSALPVLSGFLKAHGFDQVEQRDLSIEGLDYLMSPSYLEQAAQRCARNFAAFNEQPSLEPREMISYQMMGNALRNSGRIVANIEKAKAILRCQDFYNPHRMYWARRMVSWAYNLLSGAFHPTVLASGTYSTPRIYFSKSWQIQEGVEDEASNPYMDFYDHVVLDWLADTDPDLFGISITYQSQFIPALALARRIKREGLKCHVTLGGGFVSWMSHYEGGARTMLKYADSFVVNEGESALVQLADRLRTHQDKPSLTQVNNIVLEIDGKLVRGPSQMEDIDSLVTPDFGTLFESGYHAPESIYLYQSSRGCYAGCAFCCVSKHQKAFGYRRRNLDLIMEDIKTLAEHNRIASHGEKDFYLFIADDTHSPPHLRALSKRLIEEKIDVRWMCEARLDKGFDQETCDLIYEAGCRHIFFGMESANERVLKTMQKGTHLKFMREALVNTATAGIGSYVSLVIGFPTETREEAEDTIRFIREHEPYIFTVGFNPFILARGSYVHMFPEQFGVTLKPDPESDIQIVFDYDVTTGLDQKESRDLAIRAQAEWFEKRTRPRDFSLSLFDGYTLLYLAKHNLRFVDDLFADVDPLGTQNRQKRETLQYVTDSVWSNIGRSQLAHG